jgi:predicted GNAT family acetyltransferase
MSGGVVRLSTADERGIALLLANDPVVNLFLIGFLSAHPVERTWWYGVGRPVRAVVLVLPGRLAVPFAPDPGDAAQLGEHLREQHLPSMLIGPREACDRLWAAWTAGTAARRRYDQRLYRLEADHVPTGVDPDGFRAATLAEWPEISHNAARMEIEDIGVDPRVEDPRMHDAVVQERVRAGRTLVIERGGELVFQVSVGTSHRAGAQIGGTWVAPTHRGQGLAIAGVAAACRRTLAAHPRVTLHVNEANAPAVRTYERVGFARDAAFRLIVP